MKNKEFPPIIIGAETEYGVLSKTANNFSAAVALVLASDKLIENKFKRGILGIKDAKEHESIENFENIDLSKAGWDQRRGKTGYVLGCGARYYLDLEHPEFSIPECATPFDALLWQKAGDYFVNQCRIIAENVLGGEIQIFKNNSGGRGKSFGGHENYSLNPGVFGKIFQYRNGSPRKAEFTDIVLNFLISRQVIVGAGKVWMEKEGRDSSDRSLPYQISQRADFLSAELGSSTVENRPIINTRDYPYADPNLCRRLHVICGDSNMSELSLYMKFGITALFLLMLQEWEDFGNEQTFLHTRLGNPVNDVKRVSRDLSLKLRLDFNDGTQKTAVETQYEFLRLAKKFWSKKHLPGWAEDIIARWEEILGGLSTNPFKHYLTKNLDWILKKRILNQFAQKSHLPWDEDGFKDREIQYHDTNPEYSYFSLYEKGWGVFRLLDNEKIRKSVNDPPTDTRAYLRGRVVSKFRSGLENIGWDYIIFKDPFGHLYLTDPRRGGLKDSGGILENSRNAREFLEKIKIAAPDFIRIIG